MPAEDSGPPNLRPPPLSSIKVLASLRFVMQSALMESNWAAEHLQVIRTLMERSALYRRALAPIMIFNGVVGLAAAALGWTLRVGSPHAFILFWAGVAAVAMRSEEHTSELQS